MESDSDLIEVLRLMEKDGTFQMLEEFAAYIEMKKVERQGTNGASNKSEL